MTKARFSLRSLFITTSLLCIALAVAAYFHRLYNTPKPRTTRLTTMSAGSRDDAFYTFQRALGLLRFAELRGQPVRAATSISGTKHSWRSLLWHRLRPGAPEYDEQLAWHHRLNQQFDNEFFYAFCFDVDGYEAWDRHFTNVTAITGPGTIWGSDSAVQLANAPPDAVVLVECSAAARIEWMDPRDLKIDTMPQRIGSPHGICGNYSWGFMVGFADGEVWILRPDTPYNLLYPFLTIEGANQHNRDDELQPYRVDRQLTDW